MDENYWDTLESRVVEEFENIEDNQDDEVHGFEDVPNNFAMGGGLSSISTHNSTLQSTDLSGLPSLVLPAHLPDLSSVNLGTFVAPPIAAVSLDPNLFKIPPTAKRSKTSAAAAVKKEVPHHNDPLLPGGQSAPPRKKKVAIADQAKPISSYNGPDISLFDENILDLATPAKQPKRSRPGASKRNVSDHGGDPLKKAHSKKKAVPESSFKGGSGAAGDLDSENDDDIFSQDDQDSDHRKASRYDDELLTRQMYGDLEDDSDTAYKKARLEGSESESEDLDYEDQFELGDYGQDLRANEGAAAADGSATDHENMMEEASRTLVVGDVDGLNGKFAGLPEMDDEAGLLYDDQELNLQELAWADDIFPSVRFGLDDHDDGGVDSPGLNLELPLLDFGGPDPKQGGGVASTSFGPSLLLDNGDGFPGVASSSSETGLGMFSLQRPSISGGDGWPSLAVSNKAVSRTLEDEDALESLEHLEPLELLDDDDDDDEDESESESEDDEEEEDSEEEGPSKADKTSEDARAGALAKGKDSEAFSTFLKRRLENTERIGMLFEEFNDDQVKRYRAFINTIFPRKPFSSIVNKLTDDKLPKDLIALLSGLAKMYVGDLVEKAKDIQAASPSEHRAEGDLQQGPLEPKHLRAAFSRLMHERDNIISDLFSPNWR